MSIRLLSMGILVFLIATCAWGSVPKSENDIFWKQFIYAQTIEERETARKHLDRYLSLQGGVDFLRKVKKDPDRTARAGSELEALAGALSGLLYYYEDHAEACVLTYDNMALGPPLKEFDLLVVSVQEYVKYFDAIATLSDIRMPGAHATYANLQEAKWLQACALQLSRIAVALEALGKRASQEKWVEMSHEIWESCMATLSVEERKLAPPLIFKEEDGKEKAFEDYLNRLRNRYNYKPNPADMVPRPGEQLPEETKRRAVALGELEQVIHAYHKNLSAGDAKAMAGLLADTFEEKEAFLNEVSGNISKEYDTSNARFQLDRLLEDKATVTVNYVIVTKKGKGDLRDDERKQVLVIFQFVKAEGRWLIAKNRR